MSVGKKRMRLVRKTSFCFFLPKKNSKEKGRYFTTNRLFKTEQRATHHQKPPPQTGTDDFPNDERASSTRGFFRRPLSRRGTTLAPRATTLFVVSCLFLVGEIFQFGLEQKSRQVEKRRLVAKGEEMAREAVTRRLVKVCFVSPFFCDSSSARIEKDDRRCRASDRRGTFLKCHAKMCSVINRSPQTASKREETALRLTYATHVFFGLLNLLLRAGHERHGRVRSRFFHR